MPRIGLVLAGGMAKGAFQIGLLKALREYFSPEDFEYISCSSIGVLNGYAFATEQIPQAIEMWKDIVREKPLFITKIFRSPVLQEDIATLYKNNSKVPTTLYETVFNVTDKTLNYINMQEIPEENKQDFLRASVAFPVYNTPVQINDKQYLDGAPIDNIPIFPLLEKNLDYIICIYFDRCNYMFENKEFDDTVLKIVYQDETIVRSSLCFEKEKIDNMIDEGYNKTKEILDKLLVNGKDDVVSIKKHIQEFNANNDSTFRITGDMVTSNCNRLVKKLVKATNIIN